MEPVRCSMINTRSHLVHTDGLTAGRSMLARILLLPSLSLSAALLQAAEWSWTWNHPRSAQYLRVPKNEIPISNANNDQPQRSPGRAWATRRSCTESKEKKS